MVLLCHFGASGGVKTFACCLCAFAPLPPAFLLRHYALSCLYLLAFGTAWSAFVRYGGVLLAAESFSAYRWHFQAGVCCFSLTVPNGRDSAPSFQLARPAVRCVLLGKLRCWRRVPVLPAGDVATLGEHAPAAIPRTAHRTAPASARLLARMPRFTNATRRSAMLAFATFYRRLRGTFR